jgi:hypothetical protein
MTTWHSFRIALGLSVLAGGATLNPARAEFIVIIEQEGSNVVATGRGAINTTDLVDFSYWDAYSLIATGGFDWEMIGPIVYARGDDWGDISGPTSFGFGASATFAGDGGGDYGGLAVGSTIGEFLNLPSGYVSGDFLNSSATWDDTTIADLDLTPGAYTWTWGRGANADSYKLDIAQFPNLPRWPCSASASLASARCAAT